MRYLCATFVVGRSWRFLLIVIQTIGGTGAYTGFIMMLMCAQSVKQTSILILKLKNGNMNDDDYWDKENNRPKTVKQLDIDTRLLVEYACLEVFQCPKGHTQPRTIYAMLNNKES